MSLAARGSTCVPLVVHSFIDGAAFVIMRLPPGAAHAGGDAMPCAAVFIGASAACLSESAGAREFS